MRICFLIPRLDPGGAQQHLLELAKGLDRTQFDLTVLTFYDGSTLAEPLVNLAGVRHISLSKKGHWDIFDFLQRLVNTLRQIRPQILHGHFGISNLLCVLMKPILRGARAVWGMRAANMDGRSYSWRKDFIFGLQRFCARWADLIIVDSPSGRAYLRSHDFPGQKMLVIPHSIDTAYFYPENAARARMREEWKIAENDKVIGIVARFHPRQDHVNFLQAATALAQMRDDVRFVVVGEGNADYQNQLRAQFDELIMTRKVLWAGARADLLAVYNAMDVVTSSAAWGEGFSIALGEAMACGVLCVATDVGDSAMLVGDAGIIVPPQKPDMLVAAWQEILAMSWQQRQVLGEKARQKISENFSSRALVEQTSAAWLRLL